MSFEIKQRTRIEVTIYGEKFEMHKPTVEEAEALHKKEVARKNSENIDEKESIFSDMCESLAVLGMPVEFSKKMEVDHIIKLLNYISGALETDEKKLEAGL